jgi:hypothetical protein
VTAEHYEELWLQAVSPMIDLRDRIRAGAAPSYNEEFRLIPDPVKSQGPSAIRERVIQIKENGFHAALHHHECGFARSRLFRSSPYSGHG